ncbi:hypothetical protein [Rhizobium sp. Leaf384]|nr:hypothetical protein [Rhizobium sp. Leaf384]
MTLETPGGSSITWDFRSTIGIEEDGGQSELLSGYGEQFGAH